MSLDYKTAIAEIGHSPFYKAIVEKVESLSPVVPAFNYSGESNIEEIKFKLAQKQMHETICAVLRGGK